MADKTYVVVSDSDTVVVLRNSNFDSAMWSGQKLSTNETETSTLGDASSVHFTPPPSEASTQRAYTPQLNPLRV